ncbi:hypothetical protein U1Q18_027099 [Sarracenia purpurea var. burkii]
MSYILSSFHIPNKIEITIEKLIIDTSVESKKTIALHEEGIEERCTLVVEEIKVMYVNFSLRYFNTL